MLSERFFGLTIYPKEAGPTSIKGILCRFGKEYDREQASEATKALSRSPLGSVLLNRLGNHFEPEITPLECPHYKLVLAGSFLTGMTNPSDIKRLNQILCGRLVKKEDTMGEFGPLSGRRGSNYSPLSQCWKTTIELAYLVKFMKQEENMPPIDNSIENEEELSEVLNERIRVKNNNERRQMVFTVWNEIQPVISSWFNSNKDNRKLPESQKQVELNEKTLLALKPKVFDASVQLNIGGPEYQKLTSWVEETILVPMMTFVGERNLALYMKADRIWLFTQQTAENCPKKPQDYFIGEIS